MAQADCACGESHPALSSRPAGERVKGAKGAGRLGERELFRGGSLH
jgi:hypothetical protein